MDSPLGLEKMAALAAEIESGVSEGDVLAREGISKEQWASLQDEWRTRIAEGLAQGNFDLTNRYNAAFLARRASLRYGAKPAVSAAPYAPVPPGSEPGVPTPQMVKSTPEPVQGSQKTAPMVPESAAAPEPMADSYSGRMSDVPAEPRNFASQVEDEPTPAPTTPTLPAGNRVSSAPLSAPAPAANTAKKFEAREDTEPAFRMTANTDARGPGPSGEEEDEAPETPLVSGLPFRPAHGSDEVTTPRMQMATLPDALPFRPAPSSQGHFPFGAPSAVPPPAPSRPGVSSVNAPAHTGFPQGSQGFVPTGAPPYLPQSPPHPQAHAYAPQVAPMPAPAFGPSVSQPSAGPGQAAAPAFGPPAGPPKTGQIPVFNPQIPQPAAAPSIAAAPGGYPPFVPSAPSFGTASAAPPSAFSVSAPAATAPSGALPMPASLGASTSRLTLEQYAMLSAEIAVSPGTSAAVRARYGLDETMHIAESGLWQRRFSADKELFTRYSSLFQNYREWFSKTAR